VDLALDDILYLLNKTARRSTGRSRAQDEPQPVCLPNSVSR
jgi:hypothetical protein